MLSKQEDDQERRAVLLNDARIRQERAEKRGPDKPSTLHRFADADLLIPGRHGAVDPPPHHVGSTPAPDYPAASEPWQVDLPPEKPLGYSINDVDGPDYRSQSVDPGQGEPELHLPSMSEIGSPPIPSPLGDHNGQATDEPTSAVGSSLSHSHNYRRTK